jgi:hypothetical protein
MKKKLLILLTSYLVVNLMFVRMSCYKRPNCHFPITVTLQAFDNADSLPSGPQSSGVLARAFYLEYYVNDSYYYCKNRLGIFPVNAVYAGTTDNKIVTVDSVSLFSDHDFDAAHPAGSELVALFSKKKYANYNANAYRIYLEHLPSDTGTHTFTMKFYLSDSTVMAASASPVKLLL